MRGNVERRSGSIGREASDVAQCCDAFDDGAFRRWWPDALTHQYVQLNTNAFINWLNFDIDATTS